MTATYHAPAIHCEGCASAIQNSLGKLSGIDDIEVDVPAKTVTVDYDEVAVKESDIRARLEAAGFPTEN